MASAEEGVKNRHASIPFGGRKSPSLPERYEATTHVKEVGILDLKAAKVISAQSLVVSKMPISKVKIELNLDVEGFVCKDDTPDLFTFLENEPGKPRPMFLRLFLKSTSKFCYAPPHRQAVTILYDLELPRFENLQTEGYSIGVGSSTLLVQADADWKFKVVTLDSRTGKEIVSYHERANYGSGRGVKGNVQINMSGEGDSYTPSVDPTSTRRVMREHLREIRNCFERELQRTQDLGGLVVLQWKIGENGGVSEAKLSCSQSEGLEPVGKCIAQRLSTWKFENKETSVRYPIQFTIQPAEPQK